MTKHDMSLIALMMSLFFALTCMGIDKARTDIIKAIEQVQQACECQNK